MLWAAFWFAAVVGAAVLGSAASAQSAVGITPSTLHVSVAAGASYLGQVRLSNPADTALRVRTTLSDWEFDDSGAPTFFEPGTLPESASGWVTLRSPEFPMEAGGTVDATYEVRVPDGTPDGTYWSAVLFDAEDPDPRPGDTLAAFRLRVAFGLYVTVGSPTADPVVAGMIGQRTDDASYQLRVRLHNRGDALAALSGTIQVLDATGSTPITIPIQRVVALPHGERVLTATVWGPLPAGSYSALAVLQAEGAPNDIAGQYDFVLDTPLARNPTANGDSSHGSD